MGEIGRATRWCSSTSPPIGSAVERAPKELKGFARVSLAPGETRTATISLPAAELAYYDVRRRGLGGGAIAYEAIIGRHSLDAGALRAAFTVV